MSTFPDPTSAQFTLNNRIFSHCLFCVSLAAFMIAMIIGVYELLAYIIELANLGYLAQSTILMAIVLFGSILFGAIASSKALDCVEGCESFTAKVFTFLRLRT